MQKLNRKTKSMTCLALVTVIGLVSAPAPADYLPITLEALMEANGRANTLLALQQGNNNQLIVTQIGGNEFQVIQAGNDNLATVDQLGSSNQLLLNQQGDNNQASVVQYGNGSSIQLIQYGEANFAIQQLASGEHITVTQY